MRCKACNINLSDFESTRKSSTSGEFIDLCNTCYSTIQQDVDPASEREDLRHENYEED
jgi:protein-arginine kinase activator protein McsA